MHEPFVGAVSSLAVSVRKAIAWLQKRYLLDARAADGGGRVALAARVDHAERGRLELAAVAALHFKLGHPVVSALSDQQYTG